MDYENIKKGFSKLFIAEILLILASVVEGFINELSILMYIAVVLMIVAFFMNLKGLKTIANDNKQYKYAYTFTLAGIFIVIISAIGVGVTADGSSLNSIFNNLLNGGDNIFEFLVGYCVIKGSVEVSETAGKTQLAEYAKTTLTLYTIMYLISILLDLGLGVSFDSVSAAIALIVVGVIAVVLALAAQIRYIVFLNKMSKEL